MQSSELAREDEKEKFINLVNILLAMMLGILCFRYTKFYSHLSDFWKRILALAYVFILSESAEFAGFPLIGAAAKTFFAITELKVDTPEYK